MSKLDDVLMVDFEEIVREQTFSMEGVEAIKKLRDKCSEQEKTIEQDIKDLGENQETIKSQSERIKNLQGELSILQAKETDLTARESRVHQLEKESAVSDAKAFALGQCFDTIFKNTVFRETLQMNMTGYKQEGSTSETKDTTATKSAE